MTILSVQHGYIFLVLKYLLLNNVVCCGGGSGGLKWTDIKLLILSLRSKIYFKMLLD